MLAKKKWSAEEAVVSGLLWSWPNEREIVATRIEYVRSFLLLVLEQWSRGAQAEAKGCH
jgi:hypothetical protein